MPQPLKKAPQNKTLASVCVHAPACFIVEVAKVYIPGLSHLAIATAFIEQVLKSAYTCGPGAA